MTKTIVLALILCLACEITKAFVPSALMHTHKLRSHTRTFTLPHVSVPFCSRSQPVCAKHQQLRMGVSSYGVDVTIERDEKEVGKKLCNILEAEYHKAVANKGHFTFSISGGSMIKMLANLQGKSNIDWSKCTMGFVSHRAVPLDSDGATYHKARPAFLDSWMQQGLKVITPTGSSDAAMEADLYEANLRMAKVPFNEEGLAVLDLLLIGVGLDGHVGSVYPNLPDVDSKRTVLPATSGTGKITMSLAAMQAAKKSVVACAGKSSKAPLGKAEAMVRALEAAGETPMSFPARSLRFKSEWLLCADSACLLKNNYQ